MLNIKKAKFLIFINEKPIKIMVYLALGMSNTFHKHHFKIL